MPCMRATRSRLVAMLLAVAWFSAALVLPARASYAAPAPVLESVTLAGGDIRLAADAAPAPPSYGAYSRFGLYDLLQLRFSRSIISPLAIRARHHPAPTRGWICVLATPTAYGASGRSGFRTAPRSPGTGRWSRCSTALHY